MTTIYSNKQILLFTFFTFLSFFVNGQYPTHLENFNLKGKVKQLCYYRYEIIKDSVKIINNDPDSTYNPYTDSCFSFDKKSNILIKRYYTPNGDLKEKRMFNYDFRGELFDEKRYDSNSVYVSKYRYIYKVFGNNESEFNIYHSVKGYLEGFVLNKYNDKGCLIITQYVREHTKNNSYGKWDKFIKYKCNDKGYNTQRIIHNPDSLHSINSIYKYKYDNSSNIIENSKYKSDSSLIYKWTYLYDTIGNVLEKQEFDLNNKLEYRISYKYDSDNNKIEEIKYVNDNILYRYNWEYKFDKLNNWIIKSELRNDSLQIILERDIEYY
jgi:hypothetical protein